VSSGAFAVVMYLVNIPLAFLVPSSSGHATLAILSKEDEKELQDALHGSETAAR
jgi:hypothetical protein